MNKYKFFICAAILILANLVVYYPSFFDSSRGSDQQMFLSEISGTETLPGLIGKFYSHTRTRELAAGDKILFRPLVYVSLVTEKWFFGYDFFWWQITGFMLHLLSQWFILLILNVFSFSWWSLPATLLSSVLFLQQEMVGRNHYVGYLLFQVLSLAACYHFFKYYKDPLSRQKNFVLSLILLTLAGFAYEAALILNCCFAVLLFVPGKQVAAGISRRQKLLIWLPLLTYAGFSAFDFMLRVKNFSYAREGLTGSAQLGSFDAGVLLANMVNLFKVGLQGFIFPAFTKVKFIGDQYNYDTFSFGAGNAVQGLNIILIVFFVFGLILGLRAVLRNKSAFQPFFDTRVFILGLGLLVFVVAYVGLLCLTRLQTNPGYINTALHHFYTIYSFAIIGAYFAALPFLLFIERYQVGLKRALCFGLILMAFLQGYFLYGLNNDTRARWEPQRIYLREVDRFVKQHKQETDFSFVVFKSEQIYLYGDPLSKDSDDTITIVERLFPQYVKAGHPKYFIVYSNKEGLRYFLSAADAGAYVREVTNKNGRWNVDLYINGSKIDLPKLLLHLRSAPGLK